VTVRRRPGTVPKPASDSMIPDPGSVKGGLLISLAVDMFEEIGIGFVGQPRVGADGQVRLEASLW
jgi:hypothetical protein